MNSMIPRVPIRPLIWPDTILELAEQLTDSDQPIYIVGGAVRDAYFGLPLHDCDLVTPVGAAALARRIANLLKGDVYVMDAERDVARVLADTPAGRLSLDVAAYRASDLLTDLTERDFTFNAMAVDLRAPELLIDPLDGETDLKHKLIRRCTDHAIAHDPIRALRAVRQSVQMRAHIEKMTMHDIRANAGRLYETSPERVRDELVKILATQRPHAALRVMISLGLLQPILPEVAALPEDDLLSAVRTVEHISSILTVISPGRTDNTASAFGLGAMVVAMDKFRPRLQSHIGLIWPTDRPHRAILQLMALVLAVKDAGGMVNVTDYADRLVAHLRLSNAERVRLLAVLRADLSIISADDPLNALAQHRFWHVLDVAGVDVVLLGLAQYLTQAGMNLQHKRWVRVLERARTLLDAFYMRHDEIVAPPPVIDGTQLMAALSLKPGPVIRELLDLVREGQVTGEITDRESALASTREYLRSKP